MYIRKQVATLRDCNKQIQNTIAIVIFKCIVALRFCFLLLYLRDKLILTGIDQREQWEIRSGTIK